MAYTQFCAGTDTIYVSTLDDPDHQKARKGGYDYFETLSKVFDGLQGDATTPAGYETAPSKTTLLAATKDRAQFVNGPETRATDIGACIANNLLGILQALEKGETTINLVGHSRGAVAALLVTHELQALLTGLQPGQPVYDALLKTQCAYTKAAVQAQRAKFEALSSEAIRSTLQQTTVNLFAIDPVPGGNFLGVVRTAWHDDRFYDLPPIVKKAQVIIYNHEHTRCFKPILPKAAPNTEFMLLNLSGHHGTGSGNLQDQQRMPSFSGIPQYTSCVQSLMLSKITRFLHENGMHFTETHLSEIKISPEVQKQFYDEIVRNRKHFERFDHTSYAYLTQEQGVWRNMTPELLQYWFGVEKQRIIHHQSSADAYLSRVFPTILGFENLEHVRLALEIDFKLKVGSPDMDDPAAILKAFHDRLVDINSKSTNNRNPGDSFCCRHLNQAMFTSIFDALIQCVAQKYLRNHLLPEQKRNLIDSILNFNVFLKTLPEKKELLKESIKKTLKARKDTLLQRHQELTAFLERHMQRAPSVEAVQEDTPSLGSLKDALLALKDELLDFSSGIDEFQKELADLGIQYEPDNLLTLSQDITDQVAAISTLTPLNDSPSPNTTPTNRDANGSSEEDVQGGLRPDEPISTSEEDVQGEFRPDESISTSEQELGNRRTNSQALVSLPKQSSGSLAPQTTRSLGTQPVRPKKLAQSRFSASFLLAVIGGLAAGAGLIALACVLLPPVGLVTMSIALAYSFSGVGFAAGTSLLGFFGYHATKACKTAPQHEFPAP